MRAVSPPRFHLDLSHRTPVVMTALVLLALVLLALVVSQLVGPPGPVPDETLLGPFRWPQARAGVA